jgi:hypothetical protein
MNDGQIVGLILTIIGSAVGIYPAFDKEDTRVERAVRKRVKNKGAAWANANTLKSVSRIWFTDKVAYALAFSLVSTGSVLLTFST